MTPAAPPHPTPSSSSSCPHRPPTARLLFLLLFLFPLPPPPTSTARNAAQSRRVSTASQHQKWEFARRRKGAERVGFEPTNTLSGVTRFPIERTRPTMRPLRDWE